MMRMEWGTRNCKTGNHASGFPLSPWVITNRSLICVIGCGTDITPIFQGFKVSVPWNKKEIMASDF